MQQPGCPNSAACKAAWLRIFLSPLPRGAKIADWSWREREKRSRKWHKEEGKASGLGARAPGLKLTLPCVVPPRILRTVDQPLPVLLLKPPQAGPAGSLFEKAKGGCGTRRIAFSMPGPASGSFARAKEGSESLLCFAAARQEQAAQQTLRMLCMPCGQARCKAPRPGRPAGDWVNKQARRHACSGPRQRTHPSPTKSSSSSKFSSSWSSSTPIHWEVSDSLCMT